MLVLAARGNTNADGSDSVNRVAAEIANRIHATLTNRPLGGGTGRWQPPLADRYGFGTDQLGEYAPDSQQRTEPRSTTCQQMRSVTGQPQVSRG